MFNRGDKVIVIKGTHMPNEKMIGQTGVVIDPNFSFGRLIVGFEEEIIQKVFGFNRGSEREYQGKIYRSTGTVFDEADLMIHLDKRQVMYIDLLNMK